MKSNTKSSITLPPSELALVNELMKKLKAKSKVDVIRQGLRLLKQNTDRAELAELYRRAVVIDGGQSLQAAKEWEGADDHMIPPYGDDQNEAEGEN